MTEDEPWPRAIHGETSALFQEKLNVAAKKFLRGGATYLWADQVVELSCTLLRSLSPGLAFNHGILLLIIIIKDAWRGWWGYPPRSGQWLRGGQGRFWGWRRPQGCLPVHRREAQTPGTYTVEFAQLLLVFSNFMVYYQQRYIHKWS